MIDLAGMDDRIAAICAGLEIQPHETSRAMLPKLVLLVQDLNMLSAACAKAQADTELALRKISGTRASQAYGKPPLSPISRTLPGLISTNSRKSARHGDGNLSALRAGPELRAGADRGRLLGDAPFWLWRHDARPYRQGAEAGRGRGRSDRPSPPAGAGQARRGGASGAAGHEQRPDPGNRHQSAARSTSLPGKPRHA